MERKMIFTIKRTKGLLFKKPKNSNNSNHEEEKKAAIDSMNSARDTRSKDWEDFQAQNNNNLNPNKAKLKDGQGYTTSNNKGNSSYNKNTWNGYKPKSKGYQGNADKNK